MWAFFQKHIIAGVFLFLGPVIAIGSLILHAYALHEMGLPLEVWVAIGLAIFFLGMVGILIKWDQERRQSPPAIVTAPPVSVRAPLIQLVMAPQDVCYAYDDTPGRGYPHKLSIPLKNESGRDIIVCRVRWESSIGDIDATPLAEHQPWTPEAIPGGWLRNLWGGETLEPLHLPQGRVAKIWVGLLGPIDDLELRRRAISKRIGTLIVPITIDGRSETQTIKL
jgi:hypothetical protein